VVAFVVEMVVTMLYCMQHLPEFVTNATLTQEEIMAKATELTYGVLQYMTEIAALSALVTLPFLIIMFKNDKRKEQQAGIVQNKKAPLSQYVLIAGISIPFALALNNILLLSNLAEYSIAYQETSEALYSSPFPIQILCLGIIIPIMEEFIFRGLVFKRMRRYRTATHAIISSAIFFGLYHGNLVQTIYATLSGVLLAYLYEKYGSLKAPILAHILMNTVACLLTEADVFTWMFSKSIRLAVITIGCAALASTVFLSIRKIDEKPNAPQDVVV